MDQGKLKKGAIYYQCGEAAAPAGCGPSHPSKTHANLLRPIWGVG
jgi:hypothetical protein